MDINQAFVRTQAKSLARQELIQSQRAWLKQRDACMADWPCLEKAYQSRIQALTAASRCGPLRYRSKAPEGFSFICNTR